MNIKFYSKMIYYKSKNINSTKILEKLKPKKQ